MGFKLNKSGQVTLFILAGIIILFAIAMFFVFGNNFQLSQNPTENPEKYMLDCVRDSAKEIEGEILAGSYLDKNFTNYILYEREKVPYFCSVSQFYFPCVPQEPALFDKINKMVENKIARDGEICWEKLKKDYESNGYSLKEESSGISIKIIGAVIKTKIEKNIFISKDDDSFAVGNFEFESDSSLFNLFSTANVIVNYESIYCEFDYIKWAENNPEIKINRFRASDQTKIYILQDRATEREIKFAVKTCLLPAGI